ncbi:MAG: YkgJ family cysteine cluster protein [Deferrisomatales bacterium]
MGAEAKTSGRGRRPHGGGAAGGAARGRLERHVVRVQREVRSCAGCGACCTEAYNSVRILPAEAERIAEHLARLGALRRKALVARLRAAVERHGLRAAGGPTPYDCPFQEADLSCALPLAVKPTACLSFNPVNPDSCDQDPELYHAAHDEERRRNREAGLPSRRSAIPVEVLAALARRASGG